MLFLSHTTSIGYFNLKNNLQYDFFSIKKKNVGNQIDYPHLTTKNKH